jgi:ATP-dependent DNA helicase DinG
MMQSVSEILSSAGPLATQIADFSPRSQQQEMAEAIETALFQGDVLVAEAGTGTGKTFAYLVPALRSGRKVIISTGTRNLQDQLFHRDIPVVRAALGVPVEVALLKGRGNYVCHHRLALAQAEGRYRNRESAGKIQLIGEWVGRTQSGDIAECVDIDESDAIWSWVTSTSDNCLGQECGEFDCCFLVKARRNAQAADVVVINHHLLFADMALREKGFGELLPLADAIIVDEAHQLPGIASGFFGHSLSSNQLLELGRDCRTEYLREINETNLLSNTVDGLQKAVQDLRLLFGKKLRRESWQVMSGRVELLPTMDTVHRLLSELEDQLRILAERSKALEKCLQRCVALRERFELVTGNTPNDDIHWFEVHGRSVSFHLTPIDISTSFQEHMQAMPGAWVFTSATLAVNNDFRHFSSRLGLQEPVCAQWDSPFDFATQALLFLPPDMPDPNAAEYTDAVIGVAKAVVAASQGRAFLLFTSYRALERAARVLRQALDYPVMVQGDAPRDILLERFRRAGNAVLLGTSSFWEGVDVRGDALSCVVIDRLPFASPGDPVLQARIEAMRKQGANPFFDLQLPAAVITLKQGAGRLIRDISDRGVLVICDPRLRNKPYGRVFLNSLPPMPRTQSLQDVIQFFAETGAAAVEATLPG